MAIRSADPPPKFTLDFLKARMALIRQWTREAAELADTLDKLGDATDHPEGSDERALAEVRDQVDHQLQWCAFHVDYLLRRRAESSRWLDLLVTVINSQMGDGPDALHLMRRYHKLFGDEFGPAEEITDSTFPDAFAWDAYRRVCALADLADQFPRHLRHSAREMRGWPMIVSHQLDHRAEFARRARELGIGAAHPFDVSPRKRRGTETALLRYLEPVIRRLDAFWRFLGETNETHRDETLPERIGRFWADYPEPSPEPGLVALLERLHSLPALTQTSAALWSRRVIVPYIMLTDARDAQTCETPALCNIWRHRAVKSPATFQSRLHSAVVDLLRRYGRKG